MRSLTRLLPVNSMRPAKITRHDILKEESFKKAIAAINPKMGIATLASNTPSEMVQTKYGNSVAGSTNSYQLSCVY